MPQPKGWAKGKLVSGPRAPLGAFRTFPAPDGAIPEELATFPHVGGLARLWPDLATKSIPRPSAGERRVHRA
jgi:hypothetical protein